MRFWRGRWFPSVIALLPLGRPKQKVPFVGQDLAITLRFKWKDQMYSSSCYHITSVHCVLGQKRLCQNIAYCKKSVVGLAV